ncbi:unnamed protein product [Amoebophrya sp. A25]|nr:unnamed protein product [Amoebophrya sp. A25]|eukprot:GSA25T00027500001.1
MLLFLNPELISELSGIPADLPFGISASGDKMLSRKMSDQYQ